MPFYDSVLTRLRSLPLSITSLNALSPLLTSVFLRIIPPALGPTAFMRFFETVHARLAAPPNAYSDDLRVCINAYVRAHGGGGAWGSPALPPHPKKRTQMAGDGFSI